MYGKIYEPHTSLPYSIIYTSYRVIWELYNVSRCKARCHFNTYTVLMVCQRRLHTPVSSILYNKTC